MTFKERAHELVSKMTLEEKVAQMQYEAPAIERLGVPKYCWWNECLHGVGRAGTATVFPQSIAMAATFDEDLLHTTATAISDEARAKYNEFRKFGDTLIYEGLTYWSPNINIFRDPRWGRGQETYGEDPYLTGVMGSAFIRGLQGEGKYRKLDATIKHYCVHSGPEGGRHSFNAIASDKDLYETYLWAFRYCIEHADPSAVMGAYNATNGEACCASPTYLDGVLRHEFGFPGYVVSDCGAINDIHSGHKLTSGPAGSAAAAVKAGCDLNCGRCYEWLKQAVAEGLIDEETITVACERLFTARFRLGMFDDDCEYDSIPFDVVCCDKHKAINLKMAEESLVLLKNDGILPLKQGTKVAVIGPNADSTDILLGNYNGTPDEYYTLLRGIQTVSEGKVLYAEGCHLYADGYDNAAGKQREALVAAKNADAVILCMGISPRMEGEEGNDAPRSMNGDRIDLEIPDVQKKLYEEILKIGKPVIFVNVSGSAISLIRQEETANAIVQCFYPGAMGGLALANVLFGKVSPCGRLPVTFYRSVDDLPPFTDYSMKNRTYKFFEGKPLYEFGYGLTYSQITEKWVDEKTVEVKNDGSFDVNYTVLRFEYIPHKNLCGFKKVFLRAGETATVTF